MNLRGIDLNLLVLFDAVMTERNIGAAARLVGISSSAMSHALQRLRNTFNDPLFERTPTGLQPTQRASELAKSIRAALNQLEHGLGQQLDFDPSRSDRTFNIYISDYLIGSLLPQLCTRVRAEAPSVTMCVDYVSRGAADLPRPGDIHLRVAAASHGPDLRQQRILSDVFVVAMRPDHPAGRNPLTLERYANLPQLRVLSAITDRYALDDLLERKGLARRPALTIPSLAGVIPILQHTDLCALLPRQWLELYSGLAELATQPLPVEDVEYCADMVWRAQDDRDGGHRWLRQLIQEEFAALSAKVQDKPTRADRPEFSAPRATT